MGAVRVWRTSWSREEGDAVSPVERGGSESAGNGGSSEDEYPDGNHRRCERVTLIFSSSSGATLRLIRFSASSTNIN